MLDYPNEHDSGGALWIDRHHDWQESRNTSYTDCLDIDGHIFFLSPIYRTWHLVEWDKNGTKCDSCWGVKIADHTFNLQF